MTPLNGNIILKEIPQKNVFKHIIIQPQLAANQIIFAKVIALPKEQLSIKNIKVNDYVVLGYSPVWKKKYTHTIENEEYIIVNEYAILAIVNDGELLDLINIEETD